MNHSRIIVALAFASLHIAYVLGQAGSVSKPPECGTTKGCFSDCQGSTCSFVVSWSQNGTNAIYTLTATANSTGAWIAVGFSNDSIMGNDDVVGCAADANGRTAVFRTINPAHSRPTLFTDPAVNLTAISFSNGVLSCTIQRPIASSTTGTVDVSNPWTLLFARSTATINSTGNLYINYHFTDTHISARQMRVSDVTDSSTTDSAQTTTVSKPPECGTTKSCFSDCQGSTCSFIVSWSEIGTNAIYTLTATANSTGAWIAVGFSNDSNMGNDDVVGCAADANGRTAVFRTINPAHSRPTLFTDPAVNLTAISFSDGVLSCTIQRPIASSTTGTVDVSNPWTLLFARSTATINSTGNLYINYHSTDTHISPRQIRVSDVTDSSTTDSLPATSQPVAGTVNKPSGCGTSRGCFSNCEGSSCGYIVSWTYSGAVAEYSLAASVQQNSGAYIALGFSDDNKMGNDDVMGCATNASGTIVSFTAKNGERAPPTMYTDTEVKLMEGSLNDGVLSCKLQRPIGGSTNGRVSVNGSWILLFARGTATLTTQQVNLQYHGNDKYISPSALMVTNYVDVGSTHDSAQTTTQPAAGTVNKPSGCGTSRGCFSNCEGSSCGYIISWTYSGAVAEYSLAASVQQNSGAYIALGFSDDNKMGNDDVMGCATNASGTIVSFTAKNGEQAPPTMYTDTEVKLTEGSLNDGVLSCKLQRPIGGSTNGRVSVNGSWILLFARGTATLTTQQVNLQYHGNDKYISPSALMVTNYVDVGSTHDSAQTTTQPAAGTVNKPSGCGTSRGCFSNCEGSSCGYIISWTYSGAVAEYSLAASVQQNSGAYIALGFSDDNKMGNDDVMGCATNASGTIVSFTAKNGEQAPPTMYTDTEVKLTEGSLNDGVLSCKLQRPIGGSTNGRVSVNGSWILLFARGTATLTTQQVNLQYHGNDKYISPSALMVTNYVDVGSTHDSAQTTTQPAAGTVNKPSGCGTSRSCFSNCEGSSCGYIVSWTYSGAVAEYSLAASVQQNSGAYIALGFSDDNKMGNDDVMGCATNASGTIVSFTAKNGERAPPTMYTDTEVKLTEGSLNGGVLSCKLQRPIGGSTNGRVSVNGSWILLFARGTATLTTQQVNLQYHGNDKYISPSALKVTDYEDVGSTTVENNLVKAHGSLMIAAWIFLASIGIVLARYYKPVWKGLLCSEKVWFQLHRLCMVLVFCCTAAGFIIIFIDVDGYSDSEEDKEFLVRHPIIGIIVMILAVLNPVMALFRCHPGTPNRPIFNWAHLFVGTSAHILGVVNIFFGVLLRRADVPYYLVYILGAYVAWQIFIELLLEVISCCGKRMDKSEAYELSSGDTPKRLILEESSATIIVKRIILVVHCFIVAAFAAVLIGLLAAGNDKLEGD